jgi:hypothetical protein
MPPSERISPADFLSAPWPMPRRSERPLRLVRFETDRVLSFGEARAQRAAEAAQQHNRAMRAALERAVADMRARADARADELAAHVAKHWPAPSSQDVAGQRSPRVDAKAMDRGGLAAETARRSTTPQLPTQSRAPLEKARPRRSVG